MKKVEGGTIRQRLKLLPSAIGSESAQHHQGMLRSKGRHLVPLAPGGVTSRTRTHILTAGSFNQLRNPVAGEI
jgi:hypothetical protein